VNYILEAVAVRVSEKKIKRNFYGYTYLVCYIGLLGLSRFKHPDLLLDLACDIYDIYLLGF